jgi:uncharacterized RDD family membrane protein YckC
MDVIENPPYGSRGSRAGAQLLDAVVMVVPAIAAAVLSGVSESAGVVALLIAALFAMGYYLFADAMDGGQSFGKRALDLAVIDASSGAPCSITQSFVRNILLYVLGPIDWVFIFGERRQRLGDKLANTIVVRAAGGVVDGDFGVTFPAR